MGCGGEEFFTYKIPSRPCLNHLSTSKGLRLSDLFSDHAWNRILEVLSGNSLSGHC